MGNTFPKVSPDGRWIVFVQCRNAQLMRPDSQLYIVPTQGGKARRMRCNTPLMNSWHSFSPNGRWLVFSSKARSPYTQMYLAHIDEQGDDSPAILIENSTAANRAVNLPEFVNIPQDGIEAINTPAVEINPLFAEAHADLGRLLVVEGQYDQAMPHLQKALAIKPDLVEAHYYLGASLYYSQARTPEALVQWREVLRVDPNFLPAMNDAAHALAASPNPSDRNGAEAVKLAERAVQLTGARNPFYLDTLAAAYAEVGRFPDAVSTERKALDLADQQHRGQLVEGLNNRIKLYESQQPYRDAMPDAP